MKTTKMGLIARFSEYAESGVSYQLVDTCLIEHYRGDADAKVIGEMMVPLLSKEAILEMGVAQIDKEIVDLQVMINSKESKKKQLLAITHSPDNQGN